MGEHGRGEQAANGENGLSVSAEEVPKSMPPQIDALDCSSPLDRLTHIIRWRQQLLLAQILWAGSMNGCEWERGDGTASLVWRSIGHAIAHYCLRRALCGVIAERTVDDSELRQLCMRCLLLVAQLTGCGAAALGTRRGAQR